MGPVQNVQRRLILESSAMFVSQLSEKRVSQETRDVEIERA